MLVIVQESTFLSVLDSLVISKYTHDVDMGPESLIHSVKIQFKDWDQTSVVFKDNIIEATMRLHVRSKIFAFSCNYSMDVFTHITINRLNNIESLKIDSTNKVDGDPNWLNAWDLTMEIIDIENLQFDSYMMEKFINASAHLFKSKKDGGEVKDIKELMEESFKGQTMTQTLGMPDNKLFGDSRITNFEVCLLDGFLVGKCTVGI